MLMQMFEFEFDRDTNNKPVFKGWASSGQTDFNADNLVNKHADIVNNAVKTMNYCAEGAKNNFANWSQEYMHKIIKYLEYLFAQLTDMVKQDAIMVKCGEAPLALTGLNKNFDNTMSKEDQDLSNYFYRLQLHATSFANQVKQWLYYMFNVYSKRFGNSNIQQQVPVSASGTHIN